MIKCTCCIQLHQPQLGPSFTEVVEKFAARPNHEFISRVDGATAVKQDAAFVLDCQQIGLVFVTRTTDVSVWGKKRGLNRISTDLFIYYVTLPGEKNAGNNTSSSLRLSLWQHRCTRTHLFLCKSAENENIIKTKYPHIMTIITIRKI